MLLRIFDKVSEILAEFEKAATPYAVCLLQVEVADSLDRLDSMTPPDWSNPWSSPFDPPVSQIAVYLSEKHVRDLLIALRELEQSGAIRFDRHRIWIVSEELLRSIAML